MAQVCNIPLCSPFKWLPVTASPGTHIDDDWYYKRIKPFQSRRPYLQPWQDKDYTKQQIISTIAPSDIKIYDVNTQQSIGTDIPWTMVADGGSHGKIYEASIDLDEVMGKNVCLYFECVSMSTQFKWITEPIAVRLVHRNTLIHEYTNSENAHGAWFKTTGWTPRFRIQSAILDFAPDRERTSYVNELIDVTTLSATPLRKYKIYYGEAPGIPDWPLDILNRIWCCDNVRLSPDSDHGFKRYETTDGSKWEINRVGNYPMVGASIEIADAINANSAQQSAGSLKPGFITGYDIRTGLFGATPEVVHIEEIKQL